MQAYDRVPLFILGGATLFAAVKLTSLIHLMFKQGIATNGHPSERHH